jgi:hypothetical protein
LLLDKNRNPVPGVHLAPEDCGAGERNIDTGDLDVLAIERLVFRIGILFIPGDFLGV